MALFAAEAAPAVFVRAIRAGLLTAGLLTAASVAAEEAPEPERVWYQVEVVLVERTDVDTRERFPIDHRPAWPEDTLALGPVWPEPVRPRDVGELFALWQDPDVIPGPRQMLPDPVPETEDLIRRLGEPEGKGNDPGVPWLAKPESGIRPQTMGGPVEEGAEKQGTPDDATFVAESSPAGDSPTEPATGPAESPGRPRDVPLESPALDGVALELVEPPDPEDIPIPMVLAFREVAPEQRLLRNEVRRLERAAGYRVLAHRAWRQPFLAEAPALPVLIRGEDPATGELDLAGSLAIALRRYLHARLELYRRVPDVAGDWQPAPDAVRGLSPFRQPGGEGIAPIILELPPEAPEAADGWIRIVHERRMRSGETHYLDHPRIAALIRIERFLLAEPLDENGPVMRAVGD